MAGDIFRAAQQTSFAHIEPGTLEIPVPEDMLGNTALDLCLATKDQPPKTIKSQLV